MHTTSNPIYKHIFVCKTISSIFSSCLFIFIIFIAVVIYSYSGVDSQVLASQWACESGDGGGLINRGSVIGSHQYSRSGQA
mgnify:CR=1 FL=1